MIIPQLPIPIRMTRQKKPGRPRTLTPGEHQRSRLILMDDETWAKLTGEAKRRKVSRSALLRKLIESV